MNDPRRTVQLLDELQTLGLTDSAFAIVHHFDNETIERHRHYCLRTTRFEPNGTNELVQRRLELVLRSYRGGGFASGRAAVFAALCEAAVAEIPK